MSTKIIIVEKGPLPSKQCRHEIEYASEAEGRKAFKDMIAFWAANGHAAIMAVGKAKMVAVATDIVASVTLLSGENKATLIPKKTKAKARAK